MGRPADSWTAQARCRGRDVRLFYPESGHTAGAAKRVCAMCPVRAACLTEALVSGERFGVWGGTTADERRVLLRQQRGAA